MISLEIIASKFKIFSANKKVIICLIKCYSFRIYDITGERKEQFFDFLEHLANSTYFNFQDIPLHNTVESTLDKLGLKPNKYMELIYNLTDDVTRNPNEKKRVRTVDNGANIHTRQILTEYGLCYMTNNFLPEEYTSRYLIFGEYPEKNIYEEEAQVRPVQQGSFPDRYIDFNFIGFQPAIDVIFKKISVAFKRLKIKISRSMVIVLMMS